MEKILITGGTGFIGTQVVRELLERGYEVHSLVYPPFAPEQPNLIQHEMNLMDSAAVDAFLSGNHFEKLIHLAWYVGPKCQTSALNIDWLEVSLHLIKSFHKNGGKIVLAAGSMSEYDFPTVGAAKTKRLFLLCRCTDRQRRLFMKRLKSFASLRI